MNRDDIIRMARGAGISKPWDQEPVKWETLERFAAIIMDQEREACAKVVEAGTGEPIQFKTLEILRQERDRIATAIRARGDALTKLNQAAEANGEEL